jgi:molybdopterin/thiamine biosynthesis adenylyltransferase
MKLSEAEQKRYHRQMLMKGWGEETQSRLKASTVFVAGAGGLGSPVSIYLAAAGVGTIRICDFDSVELTNLNRQILHDHTRTGVNKAISGKTTLERINPEISITTICDKIVTENVDSLAGDADIIIDCLDNFPARYLLNDCVIRKNIPLVFGGIWGIDGRLSFIHSPETPCLRCIFPEAPPLEVFPVLGATAGVIGSLQALEAVKYLTKTAPTLKGELLVWEGCTTSFHKFKTKKDPACPSCGGKQP